MFERLRSPRAFKTLINLWPPYLGAGIRVEHVSPDFREIRVAMKLRWFNRNAVGTQFGGSLYSMTDPFLMLMFLFNLDGQHVVWDKSAEIEFVKPGQGVVRAEFRITEHDLQRLRERTAEGEKYLPEFEVEVLDETGEVVARVKKQLYARLKRRPQPVAV